MNRVENFLASVDGMRERYPHMSWEECFTAIRRGSSRIYREALQEANPGAEIVARMHEYQEKHPGTGLLEAAKVVARADPALYFSHERSVRHRGAGQLEYEKKGEFGSAQTEWMRRAHEYVEKNQGVTLHAAYKAIQKEDPELARRATLSVTRGPY